LVGEDAGGVEEVGGMDGGWEMPEDEPVATRAAAAPEDAPAARRVLAASIL
jgi:hypothetical protein